MAAAVKKKDEWQQQWKKKRPKGNCMRKRPRNLQPLEQLKYTVASIRWKPVCNLQNDVWLPPNSKPPVAVFAVCCLFVCLFVCCSREQLVAGRGIMNALELRRHKDEAASHKGARNRKVKVHNHNHSHSHKKAGKENRHRRWGVHDNDDIEDEDSEDSEDSQNSKGDTSTHLDTTLHGNLSHHQEQDRCWKADFIAWIKELQEQAQARNSRLRHVYARAVKSLQAHSGPIHSPFQAAKLPYIGEGTVKLLHKRLVAHCTRIGIPVPDFSKEPAEAGEDGFTAPKTKRSKRQQNEHGRQPLQDVNSTDPKAAAAKKRQCVQRSQPL